jgi:HK97 gp10 family phage protein
MADELVMRVEGLDELAQKMRMMAPRLAKNGLRAAVYAGAKVIRDEARLRAPRWTGPVSKGHPPPGTLRRSIIMKQIREQSDARRQTFYVAVRHGKQYRNQGKKGNLSQDAFYWRFVEFGTVKMSARPFMRPAFEAKKREAVEAIKQRLAEKVEESAK